MWRNLLVLIFSSMMLSCITIIPINIVSSDFINKPTILTDTKGVHFKVNGILQINIKADEDLNSLAKSKSANVFYKTEICQTHQELNSWRRLVQINNNFYSLAIAYKDNTYNLAKIPQDICFKIFIRNMNRFESIESDTIHYKISLDNINAMKSYEESNNMVIIKNLDY